MIYSSNEKTTSVKKILSGKQGDDDGDKVVPTRIQKLKNTDKERLLLGKYLKELDRWVEVYKLPKIKQTATGQSGF